MAENRVEASDAEVVSRVLGGDVNAYEVLLNRYADRVAAIVKKHVPPNHVEETAHDVFVRAYSGLEKLNNGTDFGRWISSIALRTCYDLLRKQYRSRELPVSSLTRDNGDWLEAVLASENGDRMDEARKRREAEEVLDWALDQLPPKDRMVVNLVYLEGLPGREAAELMGWSTANVKVRCFRARRKL